MKFSDVAKGIAAERPVEIQLRGKLCRPLVRPLSNDEETDVVAFAIKFAKGKGAPAEEGNAVYDSGLMCQTIALAYLDPESDPKARESFFAGPDEIRTLDTETIALLYEHQELWQRETSPSKRHVGAGDLMEMVRTLGEDEQDPLARLDDFLRLSPPTRWSLVRFMAALLVSSHVLKPRSSLNDEGEPARSSDTKPSSETKRNETSPSVRPSGDQ